MPRTLSAPTLPRPTSSLQQALDEWVQGDALDGFPVRELLDAWAADGNEAASAQMLFGTVLHWLHGLDEAVEQFPPADTPAMRHIKDQLLRSRSAMARLLASLGQHLQDQAAWPSAAAEPAGR